MNSELLHACFTEDYPLTSFAGQSAIEIMGQKLLPDSSKAYIEFYLAHAFPVTTIDSTAMHPQVVANSYRSMLHQVFDLGHIMRAYNPEENPRDRILGAIVGVEFPNTPIGGWKVQGDKSQAPGIRAVASVFKAAERADKIIGEYQSGRRKWTVSMENEYYLNTSGFLVENSDGACEGDETPADFQALGLAYYPAVTCPDDMLKLYSMEESKIRTGRDGKPLKWNGRNVTALLGGMDSSVHFKGVGITPAGKEKEAEISQLLASATVGENGIEIVNFLKPLHDFAELLRPI